MVSLALLHGPLPHLIQISGLYKNGGGGGEGRGVGKKKEEEEAEGERGGWRRR